ncbi:MAG TPA: hypothetical protein VM537_08045 [Anaerolineae bacterium]|nr:hypothetical protein [Anaerolineae bacterium]
MEVEVRRMPTLSELLIPAVNGELWDLETEAHNLARRCLSLAERDRLKELQRRPVSRLRVGEREELAALYARMRLEANGLSGKSPLTTDEAAGILELRCSELWRWRSWS